MKPRNTVLVDVEVLADQLAQQIVSGLDLLVLEQPVRPLDGLQRPLGVLRDPGEHPLALGLLPPATLRLLTRALVLKLKPPSSRSPACGSTAVTASISFLTP
jgi:hypothetical protein